MVGVYTRPSPIVIVLDFGTVARMFTAGVEGVRGEHGHFTGCFIVRFL